MIFSRNAFAPTSDQIDFISIDHEIGNSLRDSKIEQGLLTLFSPETGAAFIRLLQHEKTEQTLKELLKEWFGEKKEALSKAKEPFSIDPILEGLLFGMNLTLPFQNGELMIPPKQKLFLVDFENHGKRREYGIHIMGESPSQESAKQKPSMAPRN